MQSASWSGCARAIGLGRNGAAVRRAAGRNRRIGPAPLPLQADGQRCARHVTAPDPRAHPPGLRVHARLSKQRRGNGSVAERPRSRVGVRRAHQVWPARVRHVGRRRLQLAHRGCAACARPLMPRAAASDQRARRGMATATQHHSQRRRRRGERCRVVGRVGVADALRGRRAGAQQGQPAAGRRAQQGVSYDRGQGCQAGAAAGGCAPPPLGRLGTGAEPPSLRRLFRPQPWRALLRGSRPPE